jgi:hypothetical protein
MKALLLSIYFPEEMKLSMHRSFLNIYILQEHRVNVKKKKCSLGKLTPLPLFAYNRGDKESLLAAMSPDRAEGKKACRRNAINR